MAKKGAKRQKKAGRPPEGEGGRRVRDYPQFAIRVPPSVFSKLKALTKKTGLTRLKLFTRAIEEYEKFLKK